MSWARQPPPETVAQAGYSMVAWANAQDVHVRIKVVGRIPQVYHGLPKNLDLRIGPRT